MGSEPGYFGEFTVQLWTGSTDDPVRYFILRKLNIMKTSTRTLSFSLIILLGWMARGADIGFIEKFALAEDRKEALKLLIPGTPDYYYYHSLDAQLRGDGAAVKKPRPKLAKEWFDGGRG